MGREQTVANSRDRALCVCIRDFAEHALRRRGDLAWLSGAGGHDFLCWISTVAASGWDGALPLAVLFGSADCGTACFRAAEYDQRGVLRHTCRARCGFCDSYDRTLSPGERGWRTLSAGCCHINT